MAAPPSVVLPPRLRWRYPGLAVALCGCAIVQAAFAHAQAAAPSAPIATVPPRQVVSLPDVPSPPGNRSGGQTPSPAQTVAPGGPAVPARVPAERKVELGSGSPSKVAPVLPVPLGAGAAANPPSVQTRAIVYPAPAEECNRSSADWPTQPIRIAVLDFRYPVEREEAHDIGSTSGGPGMAVADLVFQRLEALADADPRFAFSRGDRRRLDRTDFAGAARLGRQLGADAVLTGTLVPVVTPPASHDPDAVPVTTYELRAGLVDTCTGQLLLRLSSVACPQSLSLGLDPQISGPASIPCQRFAVAAADVADPKVSAAAFDAALTAMLYPLEHNDTPRQADGAPREGSAGVVTAVTSSGSEATVTLRIAAQARLAAGDQVAVHAWRLAKNPETYTLHALHDEEIGRVTLSSVQGRVAFGKFSGSFPPRAGDTVDILRPQ